MWRCHIFWSIRQLKHTHKNGWNFSWNQFIGIQRIFVSKKKQKRQQIKEIKFRPVTEKNDYEIKVNKIKSFIENGDKAKITLRFRGREMAHQQIGMELLKRVESDLESMASVEQFPTLEGRQLVMMMAPNKKN